MPTVVGSPTLRSGSLDFLHIPLIDTADPAHDAPLAELRLPVETRSIAGLVYEDGHTANRERLRLAEAALGATPTWRACNAG